MFPSAVPSAGRMIVAGPGAVGQVCGGKLARAGHEVIFLGRPDSPSLRCLAENGVRVACPAQPALSFSQPARTVTNLVGQAPADLVLLTSKTYHNPQVFQSLQPVVTEQTILMSLQNGVESADQLRLAFTQARVLHAVCRMGAALQPDGSVRLNSPECILMGDTTARQTDALHRAFGWLNQAGITAQLVADIRREQWLKLLWNVGIFQWCALLDVAIGGLLANPTVLPLAREAMLETVRLGQAVGISLQPTDVEEQLDAARSRYPHIVPSLVLDYRAGKPLEVEAFSGFVVRCGAELNIPTPLNSDLCARFSAAARG